MRTLTTTMSMIFSKARTSNSCSHMLRAFQLNVTRGSIMGSRRDFILRVLWYGGSSFDAWLNIVAAKTTARLHTFPQSTAQLGLPSAIVYQIMLSAIGVWTNCIINVLYLKFKLKETQAIQQSEGQNQSWHTTQLHEVIGGLLGSRWKTFSLLFNLVTMFCASFLILIACSNIVYSVNNRFDKRTWTAIFGAVFSLSIFIPSAHNYRIWSFIGVVTIIFDSIYMTIGTAVHEKVPNVTHSAPRDYQEYFTGLVGLLIIGNVPIPVEIMDAMWNPNEYQRAYVYGMLCILLVVMVPSITMERKFGDKLLTTLNSLVLLPRSKFHDTANVLMLIHLFINFGMYSISVYAMWEKLLRAHDSPSYVKRTLVRIPVFLAFLVAALAFPFFGSFYKLMDPVLATWNFYIIPLAAYTALFWSPKRQRGSKPFSRLSWVVDLSVNIGIILWMLIIECGLGFWGDVHTFLKLRGFKLFAKCYDCKH